MRDIVRVGGRDDLWSEDGNVGDVRGDRFERAEWRQPFGQAGRE